ncbi:MAG: DUF952 domain-containing protein [Mariniblastus sp.]|nr:DUF952 domain-containing protein [Mariniblastus sp.]
MSSIIYKIVARDTWNRALENGSFEGAEIDLEDGFIHFSSAEQVRRTADRFFQGRDGLVLVGVDARMLGDELKWEPAADGTLFPHLYDPLPLSAVVSQDELVLEATGGHQFPDHLPA